jgi:hypothetical protein
MCLFRVFVRISNYEISCTHVVSNNKFFSFLRRFITVVFQVRSIEYSYQLTQHVSARKTAMTMARKLYTQLGMETEI